MLESVGYSDLGVVDEVCEGVELTGDIPPSGIFEPTFKAAELTVQSLMANAQADRLAIFHSSRTSGDADIDQEVLSKTRSEVECGWARGPIALSELPASAVVSRRFGLKQSSKVRLIDDMSGSRINQTVQALESPKPQGTDMIAALVLEILQVGQNVPVTGRSFDMKAAYKQLPLSENALGLSYVAIYNPETREPELYQLLAAPFGATRSVYTFLRTAASIWYLGSAALAVMWTHFFDDYVAFAARGDGLWKLCAGMALGGACALRAYGKGMGKGGKGGYKGGGYGGGYSGGYAGGRSSGFNGGFNRTNDIQRATEMKRSREADQFFQFQRRIVQRGSLHLQHDKQNAHSALG
eukprot:Skav207754  [mRNA]  locus=scaffold181:133572:138810:- [translate_table: standard]